MSSVVRYGAIILLLCLALYGLASFLGGHGSGNKEQDAPTINLDNASSSSVTLKDLAAVYWPDSNATEVQKEETLKNLIGKRVIWEISVAEIQRQDDGSFLVQGQSDKNMIGTFSYVTPQNEAERQQLVSVSREGKLALTGIVVGMKARHIILNPARVVVK